MDDPEEIDVDSNPIAVNVDGTDEDLRMEIDNTGVLVERYDDVDILS